MVWTIRTCDQLSCTQHDCATGDDTENLIRTVELEKRRGCWATGLLFGGAQNQSGPCCASILVLLRQQGQMDAAQPQIWVSAVSTSSRRIDHRPLVKQVKQPGHMGK